MARYPQVRGDRRRAKIRGYSYYLGPLVSSLRDKMIIVYIGVRRVTPPNEDHVRIIPVVRRAALERVTKYLGCPIVVISDFACRIAGGDSQLLHESIVAQTL
jgi:hypothetical protein